MWQTHAPVCTYVCVWEGSACFFFSTFQQDKVGCEPRLWDLDERRSLDGTWLRDMFFRQNRTWHLLRQNLIKLKQNTAIVAACVLCVCHVWNGTVQKRYGLVSAQHHQHAGFSLIYTQALTNDRCAQWCLKHFYEAVGVIKNVYYDGAERLAGRMLLITSYCFKWIRWEELLKSRLSRRFNPLKVISFPEMKGWVRGELYPPSCNMLQCIVQSDVEQSKACCFRSFKDLHKDRLQFSGAWKPQTVAEGCLPVSMTPGTCTSWQRGSVLRLKCWEEHLWAALYVHQWGFGGATLFLLHLVPTFSMVSTLAE